MVETFARDAFNSTLAFLGRVAFSETRVFWVYLLSSLILAGIALSLPGLRRGEGKSGLLLIVTTTILDRRIWLHRSAIVDYACFAINALLAGLLRFASIAGGAFAGALIYPILVVTSGKFALSVAPDTWALAVFTLCSLLVADFGNFFGHHLLHRVPLLWEFHKVHHSAQVLTPITLYRIHPVEVLLTDFIAGFLLGATTVVGYFVFGSYTDPFMIFGLNAGVFLFYLLGANLRHSHIWIPYPAWLSRILISPAQHQIHHSVLREHHDKNFGVMFALWDWIFGSLYIPAKREEIVFGLADNEDVEYQSIRSLYLLPLQKAWRRIRPLSSGDASATPIPPVADAKHG